MPGKQSALTSALSKGQSTQVNGDNKGSAGSAAAALACKKIDSCPRESFPCLYVHENDREPLDAEKFDDEERIVHNDSAARFLSRGADELEPASYRRGGSIDFGRRSIDGRGSLDGAGSQAARWAKLGSPAMASSFMGPESMGSLPKGLTPDERARLSASTPLTPSLQILSTMPPESVSARTKEARRLRRRLLKSTVLVFIVAGYEGKRFIYERAKELNVKIVIIDEADSWSRQLLEDGVIERFIPFDFSDQETVFERCMTVIRRIEKDEGQVDGVLSFWELSQALVSRLAEALGLPGNPPSAVDAARDKQQTREVMARAGLASPKNILIHSPADLPKAAAHVGFPAVIKPITGAASLGVIRVDSEEHLEGIYNKVCREVGSLVVDPKTGDFAHPDNAEKVDDGTSVVKQDDGSAFIAQTFMMETYLDGPEVDVDVVFNQGACVYGAITDNWPTIEPYFNETGSNCPSILPMQNQRELCELAVNTVAALGFQAGVFHVEGKATSHGAHIIEVNARMGGGPVRDINRLVWGVDLVEEALLAAAGIPSCPYLSPYPLRNIAEYSVNAEVSGTLQNIDFLQAWQSKSDVLYCRPLVQAGDHVVSVNDGLPTWVYEMMVTRPDIHEAIDYVKSIEQQVSIPIET